MSLFLISLHENRVCKSKFDSLSNTLLDLLLVSSKSDSLDSSVAFSISFSF